MAKRKIRLNQLSQYKKESDRLILDTYSAGCGGIVLRWRDPNGGTPVRFAIGCTFGIQMFLDGKPIRQTALLKPGEHLLAIRCTENDKAKANLIALQFMLNYPDSGREPVDGFNSNTSWVCHGLPRVTDAEQDGTPQWTTLDYDATDWSNMTEGQMPEDERQTWMFRYIVESGGQLLSLPNAKEILIRYRFNWERQ